MTQPRSSSTPSHNLQEPTPPPSPSSAPPKIRLTRLCLLLGIPVGIIVLGGVIWVWQNCPKTQCPVTVTAQATVVPNPKTHDVIRMPISGLITLKIEKEDGFYQQKVEKDVNLFEVKSSELIEQQNRIEVQKQQANLQASDAQSQNEIVNTKVPQLKQAITDKIEQLERHNQELPSIFKRYEAQVANLRESLQPQNQKLSRLEEIEQELKKKEQESKYGNQFDNLSYSEKGVSEKSQVNKQQREMIVTSKVSCDDFKVIPKIACDDVKTRIASIKAEISSIEVQKKIAEKQAREREHALSNELMQLENSLAIAEKDMKAAENRKKNQTTLLEQLSQHQKNINQLNQPHNSQADTESQPPLTQTIKAKQAGTIITPNLKALEGKFLQAGEAVLETVNLDDLGLEIEIPQTDAGLFNQQTQAENKAEKKREFTLTLKPQGDSAPQCTGVVEWTDDPIYRPKEQTQQVVWKVFAKPKPKDENKDENKDKNNPEPLETCMKRMGATAAVEIKATSVDGFTFFNRVGKKFLNWVMNKQ